jgi:hypothetical protein
VALNLRRPHEREEMTSACRSRPRAGAGAEIFHNLIDSGFVGVAIPVNPTAQMIEGVKQLVPNEVPAMHRIVLATDLGDASVEALRYAVALAQTRLGIWRATAGELLAGRTHWF